MVFHHKSVLLSEAVSALNVTEGGIYVDGTLGAGGHSRAILESSHTCRLIGIDRDEAAHKAARENLIGFEDRCCLIEDNYSNISAILDELQIAEIDGMLLDLGVSSHQLDEEERGFSYRFDARLDMRMNRRQSLDAWTVVNTYDEATLADLIFRYSDEKWAKRIAEFIVKERKKPINTTFELVEVLKKAIPHGARRDGGHPAKRTFQAIRMEVNAELAGIEKAIDSTVSRLKKGGRLVIITFHSIEDRTVKSNLKKYTNACTCPASFPLCTCGRKNSMVQVGKVITASEDECSENSRASSAKLRCYERI